MKNTRTPLHRVEGMGSSHSGTEHFWHERITSVALIPLTLWFAYATLGLAGASEVTAVGFLAHPWNALLMAGFVIIAAYHIKLGLQVVIDDYVHTAGTKIFLLLLVRFFVIAIAAASLFALARIVAL